MIELISEKTREQIEELFNKSESSIQIVSPFLSVKTAEILCKICKKRNINCTLVTRIYIKDLIDGVNSLKALKLLLEAGVEKSGSNTEVRQTWVQDFALLTNW